MTAKQFIDEKGTVLDPVVRFVQAGNTVVIPLADLLEEFAAENVVIVGGRNAGKTALQKVLRQDKGKK